MQIGFDHMRLRISFFLNKKRQSQLKRPKSLRQSPKFYCNHPEFRDVYIISDALPSTDA